ncbi:hypothetical protein H5410_049864 [Solanum commersonii]|uniref:ATP-dependent DNA helicase n=1 Tax=Solanum commersonii TaxID=4109 RepID=A0A9J5WVD7_SOLCO|nr:hypothetical protein H5410_049864 [Solanum commersonii]
MAYNIILDVLSNKFGAFFIDGPVELGKSFYIGFISYRRHKGFIALEPQVESLHSRFKIPIDVNENFTCNISKQSSLASLIRDARLIVWDEISMAKKKMVEAFDLLLRDLMETNTLFGGKIVVLVLSKNMRATKDPEFCEYLMRIGDGKEKTNDHGKIEIPHSLIIPFTLKRISKSSL